MNEALTSLTASVLHLCPVDCEQMRCLHQGIHRYTYTKNGIYTDTAWHGGVFMAVNYVNDWEKPTSVE
jgi:hypothetical protein